MSEHHFETPTSIDLYVELGRGSLRLDATAPGTEAGTTLVEVTGPGADRVVVEQRNLEISVHGPREGLGFDPVPTSVDVVVRLPADSRLVARLGSAVLEVRGSLGSTHVKAGAGDVRLDVLSHSCTVETGSGDVHVTRADGEVRVKSGSGDVTVARASGALAVSTGSGDVRIDRTDAACAVKTGSGDLVIGTAGAGATYATASGDLRIHRADRGRITSSSASGDVAVAVPSGVPVWTDITTVSGRIHSTVPSAGRPGPDQDHLELRTNTVSGDVHLSLHPHQA